MRARLLLLALGGFTLVNAAITFYLVRTMYSAEQQPAVAAADSGHEAVPVGPASRDLQPPSADVQASRTPQPELDTPSSGARRRRLRCVTYKDAAQRSGRGHARGECYGDRGTPYVQKMLAGYFEMTNGDDWDLLWTLVPQARYNLARHRPELFCAECDLSPRPLRLWCDDQVDSIMFLAGAGDKCHLAKYLAAVNDAHPLHSFIAGTQLLRLPNDRAKFREQMVASGVTRWIFKPCSGGGGDGQGIVTADDLTALPEVGAGVAQPYVMNPYLYQGVKFHLRLYVLVTSYQPLRVLLSKDGLLKRAGSKYEEVEDAVLTEMQRGGGDTADRIRKAHWTNQHVNKETPPLPLSKFFSAVDMDSGDHGLGGTAREVWRQLRVSQCSLPCPVSHQCCACVDPDRCVCQGDLSKILCARVNPAMPDMVTQPPWSEARYGNCFDILGVDVMFDHGDGSDGTSGAPRPRLLEINVGPDLTAHDGWEDELNIHRRMMLEVAGLLGSRCATRPLRPVLQMPHSGRACQLHTATWRAERVTHLRTLCQQQDGAYPRPRRHPARDEAACECRASSSDQFGGGGRAVAADARAGAPAKFRPTGSALAARAASGWE